MRFYTLILLNSSKFSLNAAQEPSEIEPDSELHMPDRRIEPGQGNQNLKDLRVERLLRLTVARKSPIHYTRYYGLPAR